jgi:hypothetical protein
MWSFVCCLYSIDEMLIRFSLVFDRWTTTPTLSSEPADGFIATGCTVLASLPYSGTCCATLSIRGPPRTVAAHTVRSGVDAMWSTWMFRLTPLIRAWQLDSPRLRATIIYCIKIWTKIIIFYIQSTGLYVYTYVFLFHQEYFNMILVNNSSFYDGDVTWITGLWVGIIFPRRKVKHLWMPCLNVTIYWWWETD